MYIINRASAAEHTIIPINALFNIEFFTSAVDIESTHFLIKGVINLYGVMVLPILHMWWSMTGQSIC